MGQDRTSYQNDRILIEASRILTPQFAGTTITIDGAQVELLRNIVSYLHQERTFVSEYHGTYYLTASDADFDDLSAIVADLEEKLMGNPNVVWGFGERINDVTFDLTMPAGNSNLTSTDVPAGKVWRITHVCVWIVSATCTEALVVAQSAADIAPIHSIKPIVSSKYYPATVDIVMREGDQIYARFYNMTLDDTAYLYLWGYSMDV